MKPHPPQPSGQLLFAGDPHGRFRRIFRAAEAMRPVAIILLGDNQPGADGVLAALDRLAPVHYILGNHDPDGVTRGSDGHLYCPSLRRHREELPAQRDLSGRVVTLGGYRVAGLGGTFRGRVWDPAEGLPGYRERNQALADPGFRAQRGCGAEWDWPGAGEGPPVELWGALWPEDYAALWGQPADILVTHEGPECCRATADPALPRGLEIGELARSMGASTLVHGHHHTAYRATMEGGITVMGLHKVAQPKEQREERLQDLCDEEGVGVC